MSVAQWQQRELWRRIPPLLHHRTSLLTNQTYLNMSGDVATFASSDGFSQWCRSSYHIKDVVFGWGVPYETLTRTEEVEDT